MRTRLRSKVTLLFVVCAALLAIPAVALADVILGDADFVAVGNQSGSSANPIDLGPVKGGGTLTKEVSFLLQCNGNNHVDNGQTVLVNLQGHTLSSGSVTATNATIGPIPTSWPDDTTGSSNCAPTPQTLGDNGNSKVTVTAPATAGTYNFSVTWNNNNITPTQQDDSNDVTGNTQVFFKFTVENTAPTVTSVAPADGATGVAIGSNVEATFSEAMDASTTESDGDPSTIDGSTFTLTKPDGQGGNTSVGGVVSYDSATKKATLNPNSDLDYSTTYTATVTTGAQDVAGNALDQDANTAGSQPETWSFTTAAPPCTAPSVTTQPTGQTVTYGADAEFTAAASGSPTPSVKWQVSTDGGNTWNDVPNATSSKLTLTKPSVADSGNQYQAVFTNTCSGTKTATSNAATLTVNKATATVTLSNLGPHVYDGTAKAATASTIPSGLNVRVTYDGSETAPTNAGSYTVEATVDEANYQGSDSGTLEIAKADQTINFTSTAPTNAVYGDTYTPAATGGGSGNAVTFGASGACSYDSTTGKVTMTSAGSNCTVTADQAGNTNYNDATQAKQQFSVAQRPITVTAAAKNKDYGDSDPTLTYSITSGSLVSGDSFTGSLSRDPGENVGIYAINQGTVKVNDGNSGNNYAITYVGANLTIGPATLTVNANGATTEYGEAPTLTPDISGFKFGENSNTAAGWLGAADCSLTSAAGTNVGTYANAIECTKGDLAATNYVFVNGTGKGTLTITKRPITVTADAQSKFYGDADPALTYKVTSGSTVNGDSFSGALSRVAGEDVGNYAIQQGSLALSSNYDLSYVGANLAINKAPITLKANDFSRYYGEANNLSYSIVSGGFKFNDLANGGVTVNLSTTATATSQNGTYPITVSLSGPKAGNYAATLQPGTLTIKAWTNQGFFSPVDYGTTQNTVKGGSTVPLKFRVFQGTQQLTSTSIVSGLKPAVTNCTTGVPIDDIEELTTGGTSLRYDTTGGQFIFNWQTPKKPGTCYNVTVQMVDNSSIPIAKFWLK